MKKINKILKMLCFFMISIFMIGFGKDVVKANDEIIVNFKDPSELDFNDASDVSSMTIWPKIVVGTGDYIFCLDSHKKIPGGDEVLSATPNYLSSEASEKVVRVLEKAYSMGLGTSSNDYGITDTEFYQITQIAVWYAARGVGDNGYQESHADWLIEDGHLHRQEVFKVLIGAIESEEDGEVNEIIIKTDSSNDGFIEDGDNLLSADYYVYDVNENISDDLTYVVKIDDSSMEDACLLYNGECSSSINIKASEKFKVQVTKPNVEAMDVSVNVSVVSAEFEDGYDVTFYTSSSSETQGMITYVPAKKTVSADFQIDGKFNNTVLSVSKTDVTGQKELSGANMELYDNDGKLIESWVSKENEEHRIVGLNVGEIYEIIETVSPKGYAPLETSIYFVLNIDGTVTTCETSVAENDNKCEAMSTEDILKIKNDVTKVLISKRDLTTGEELVGAHLQILDENGTVIEEWDSKAEPHYIEMLPIGKYTLVETIGPDGYEVGMIIDGVSYTEYEFEIKDNEVVEIIVHNEIIKVPNTGIDISGNYVIGSMVILFGIGTIVFVRKKEII